MSHVLFGPVVEIAIGNAYSQWTPTGHVPRGGLCSIHALPFHWRIAAYEGGPPPVIQMLSGAEETTWLYVVPDGLGQAQHQPSVEQTGGNAASAVNGSTA